MPDSSLLSRLPLNPGVPSLDEFVVWLRNSSSRRNLMHIFVQAFSPHSTASERETILEGGWRPCRATVQEWCWAARSGPDCPAPQPRPTGGMWVSTGSRTLAAGANQPDTSPVGAAGIVWEGPWADGGPGSIILKTFGL